MAGPHEVAIDVVVRERGGKKVIKDVGDEVKKTGTKLSDTAKDTRKLNEEMLRLETRLRNTAKELKETGSISAKQASQFKRDQGQLRKLMTIRSEIMGADTSGGGPGGLLGKLGKGAGGAAGGGLSAIKGPAIGAAVGVGVAAAPFLGGVIASAVLGGVGTGGIIGGLALAAHDSRVQDAGEKLGAHAMAAFSRSAEPFVAPAIEAMGVLRGVVDDVSGDMRQAFATIAPVLVPLTQGLGGFLHQMMPGIIKALEGARPVLLIVARELPKIGAAIGRFLSTIAEDPRGAIRAFQDLSRIIQGTIILTGNFIAWLAKVWGVLGPIIQASQGDIPGMVGTVGATEQALADAAAMGKDAANSFTGVGESAKDAATRLQLLNGALDKFFDRTLGIRSATREYEASVDNLTKTIKENGKTLDERTEKGRANEQAIDDNIRAIKDLRQANIDNGMAVEDANAIYDAQLEQLRKTLLKLGLNKDEVNALIDAIKKIPAMAEVEVRAPGLLDALAKARELAALLGSGSAAARYRAGDTSGYGGGRASGGLILPGMSADVAESGTGVERIKALRGGGVLVSNADQWSAAMSGASGGGWSGGAQNVNLTLSVQRTGNDLEDALMAMLAQRLVVSGGYIGRYKIEQSRF